MNLPDIIPADPNTPPEPPKPVSDPDLEHRLVYNYIVAVARNDYTATNTARAALLAYDDRKP